MALQDIKDGKIAAMQVERANFTVNTQQAGKADKMTGEIVNLASRDFDATAAAAILDPQKANDDRYYRVYGKTTAGPYTVTSRKACACASTQMTIDDVGVRPSRLQLPALLAMIQAAGAAPPTPAQARELMDKMAALYEGMRIGTAEMRGLSAETPQGPFKLAGDQVQPGKRQDRRVCARRARYTRAERARQARTLRAQIARYRQLHADVGAVREPGAAAVTRTDRGAVSAASRVSRSRASSAPFKNTGKLVNLDSFDLNWGQFVGPIPSKVRLTAKMTTPVDAADPSMKALVAAGLDTLSADGDIGAEWTEAARSFVLDVPKLEIGGLLKASARSRSPTCRGRYFRPTRPRRSARRRRSRPARSSSRCAISAASISGSPNMPAPRTSAATRRGKAIVESIMASSAGRGRRQSRCRWPPCRRSRALSRARGQTLIIKLTPRAKVPAMQLVQLLKTDPLIALAQFRIEASTGL